MIDLPPNASSKMTTKDESTLPTPHLRRSLTSCRPISRAYVYSLVERVALLEQMLEDQGLTVPPANYPPETRHRSRRSKDTSSADIASSFSSTPQESSSSDHHATSPPYCEVDQGQDENRTAKIKKRTSISLSVDNETHHGNKRKRHDSLIMTADVKIESPVDSLLGSVERYDGTFEFEPIATTNTSSRLQPPFWPMTYDHTGGLTALIPPSQDTNVEYPSFNAWGDDAFNINGYSNHTFPAQYGETRDEYQFSVGRSPREMNTNLDFMSMGTSS